MPKYRERSASFHLFTVEFALNQSEALVERGANALRVDFLMGNQVTCRPRYVRISYVFNECHSYGCPVQFLLDLQNNPDPLDS